MGRRATSLTAGGREETQRLRPPQSRQRRTYSIAVTSISKMSVEFGGIGPRRTDP